MVRPRFVLLGLVLSASITFGCSSDDDGASPPSGVTCGSVVRASSAEALASSVASASAGTCVVVSGALTSGAAIALKSGVALVGAAGTRPSLTVTDGATTSAVSLADGAQLGNLDVLAAPHAGVRVTGANTRVFDVTVSGAKGAGLVVDGVPGAVTIQNAVLEKNGYGLFARGAGANVAVRGGRVSDNGGVSLAAGIGIVGADGASVSLDGVTVQNNAGTGILLDGAATRAVIKGSTVADNRERGIWAQGLQGTIDAPALSVQDTEISKNRIVGMGGVELKGIIIVGGSVKETVAAPIATDLAAQEQVGDGLGIFGGSTDLKVESTSFERNARAAGVVDHMVNGIIIVGGKVDPGDSGVKFVVQNSSGNVQIDASLKTDLPKPLGISAPKIKLPADL